MWQRINLTGTQSEEESLVVSRQFQPKLKITMSSQKIRECPVSLMNWWPTARGLRKQFITHCWEEFVEVKHGIDLPLGTVTLENANVPYLGCMHGNTPNLPKLLLAWSLTRRTKMLQIHRMSRSLIIYVSAGTTSFVESRPNDRQGINSKFGKDKYRHPIFSGALEQSARLGAQWAFLLR